MITDEQGRRALHYLQRLRDRLAVDICHNGLRDAREYLDVCALIDELRPVVRPERAPGGQDRRRNPR